MDEVFNMFFDGGDMDEFIRILEGDNDKKTRKMFRDLGKNYRPRAGRAGLAARKHQNKQMKLLEKQMMNDLMGDGMEEMIMMTMMMGDLGLDKMGMSKDERKMME
jgi:hypothetical protein